MSGAERAELMALARELINESRAAQQLARQLREESRRACAEVHALVERARARRGRDMEPARPVS